MLWLFVVAIVMPITMGSCEQKANLTAIRWDHAVNSQDLLKAALSNNVSCAIEADVMMGTKEKQVKILEGATEMAEPKIPIMSHASEVSDLTLEEFLGQIMAHNGEKNAMKKAAKLDFKQTEALTASVDKILQGKWNEYSKVPVWINADILDGPVVVKTRQPVYPTEFFLQAKKLENATLSLGWVTPEKIEDNVTYTSENINAMITAINGSGIKGDYGITFAVRANLAVRSQDQMKRLFDEVSKNFPKTTFTVWSSNNDKVDEKQLTSFIKSYGTDKVYLDVPKDLLAKINVNSGASSLVQFGLLNMVAIALALFFSFH